MTYAVTRTGWAALARKDGGVTHNVLFVCEANVCRSPLMAFAFEHDDRPPVFRDLSVGSRGTAVGNRRLPLCDIVGSLIDGQPGAESLAAGHQATQLLDSDLEAQELVITASRAERSAVARLDPSLRSRTFTLREAIWLGADRASAVEREMLASAHGNPVRSRVAGFAALLNSRRGLLPAPASRRSIVPWAAASDPLDVPDAHHVRDAQHVAVLKSMRADVIAFRSQLARFVSE